MAGEAAGPILSIVTVCKDIAPRIGDTCASVAAQTWRGFEWIVVDGASRDGTLAELEKWRRDMAVLVSEPDRGVYHAMNKGIGLARGEYLLFLNGGDYLASPGVLAEAFSVGRTADVLYGDELHLHPEDGFLETVKSPPAGELDKLFFAYDVINHQAAFIRRELFRRFGPYDENFPIAADHEKWVVFAAAGCSFEKLEQTVSAYRLDGESSRPEGAEKLGRVQERIRERHFSKEELRRARLARKRREAYRPVPGPAGTGRFRLFSVEETWDGRKRKYRILGLPALTVRRRRNRRTAFLFGMLPLPGAETIPPAKREK